MADERRIVIELKLKDPTDSGSDENESENLTEVLEKMQHPLKTLERKALGKSELLYFWYGRSKELIKSYAKFQIGMYFNLTENYKAEQTLENTISILDNVSSSVGSVFAGAIAGAKAGPVGALVGAGIGATFSVATTLSNAVKSFIQQDIQLTTMNMQSSYQRVKLGLIDDGRGTQN